MKFDINQVFSDMLSAMQGELKSEWPKARTSISSFLERRKNRLETLISLHLQGELSETEFASRIEDEKQLLEAEMEAIKAVSKAMAQKAANATIEVLEKAVKVAVGKRL
jgi:hypothetical protein